MALTISWTYTLWHVFFFCGWQTRYDLFSPKKGTDCCTLIILRKNWMNWVPYMFICMEILDHASPLSLGGVPASQPHTPPEPCLCFASSAACSEAAFWRCRISSSFRKVSIVCSFCLSSATSTCSLKLISIQTMRGTFISNRIYQWFTFSTNIYHQQNQALISYIIQTSSLKHLDCSAASWPRTDCSSCKYQIYF